MQADIVLEKKLQILHLNPQAAGNEWGILWAWLLFLKPQRQSRVTHFFQQGHTSWYFQIMQFPDDQAFKSKSLLGSFSFKSPFQIVFLLWWNNCEGHVLYHFTEFSGINGLYLPTQSKIIFYFKISVNLALFSKKCHILRNLRLTHFIGC